ncbi:hypothetical protein MFFC18_06740 [Mariniblastus fucicola]|uniref:Uncharacterized protein n=1 Tax=Mariniblastus fucicola TaxID=980251 RepID=A0A5B9PCE7_9BACT|nr:hypothetical protein MFFC18_06740 [Mariniblastus fucicola]
MYSRSQWFCRISLVMSDRRTHPGNLAQGLKLDVQCRPKCVQAVSWYMFEQFHASNLVLRPERYCDLQSQMAAF